MNEPKRNSVIHVIKLSNANENDGDFGDGQKIGEMP